MLFKDILSFKWWKIILIESRPWKVQWEIFFYVKVNVSFWIIKMAKETIQEQVKLVRDKREFLVGLLEKPDLGILKIDVRQALEELDELIENFEKVFSENL